MDEFQLSEKEPSVINYRSISCERIPDLFLDKLIAKNHFGKFGKINRFILRPNRFSCTVEYDNEKSAADACENARTFNGQKFDINFSVMEEGHVQNTEEWVDPDVQAELDAMDVSRIRSFMRVSPFAPKVQQNQPTESLVFSQKSQTQSVIPSSTLKADSGLRSELEAVMRRPALSDEDKYRVLDARDKLLRLKTIRETDIKKAGRTKGTCPDMCPEKERFMREYQRQVSTFEMENGNRNNMNHRKAIKEYSRSSADQETPLSHELRPEKVLKMTMLYLMHRIMDLCNDPGVPIGEWFHFVWDRTRSIRKDITQQELCSPGAVELVEQCARFHIHCAARLVAEDSSVFDQKINTENLTKCLQTLKYMYHDLRLKNVCCPCEAEFRSYVILLNLNNGNFLWEIKQLPEDIQNSIELKTAIGFYKTMESNNYVKFFQLVRQTNYMFACILLRYFTQVRLRALRTMIKAYNWGKNAVSLNLDYFVNLLGFESEESARRFFIYYNLVCDDDKVILDKATFYVPDVPFPMERATLLVESKLTTSVGECVSGAPLPSSSIFDNHVPHNSFDSNSFLKTMSWSADDQLLDEPLTKVKGKQHQEKFTNVFKVPHGSTHTPPKQIFKMLANESIGEELGLSKRLNILQHQKDESALFSGPQTDRKFTPFFNLKYNSDPFAISRNNTNPDEQIFHKPQRKKHELDAPEQFSANIFRPIQTRDTPAIVEDSGEIMKYTPGIKNDSQSLFNFNNNTNSEQRSIFETKLNFKERKHEQEKPDKTKFLQNQNERINFDNEICNKENLSVNEPKETVSKDTCLEKTSYENKKKQESRQKALSQRAENILKGLLFEAQQVIIKQEAENELRNVLHQKAMEIQNELIEECVYEVVAYNLILLKYFIAWHKCTRRKIIQREIISNTPIWVTTKTREEQANEFAHPGENENLKMMRRYRVGQPCNFSQLLYVGDDIKQQEKVNIFSILASNLKKSQRKKGRLLQQRQYFKVSVSLPGGPEEPSVIVHLVNQWINNCIYKPSEACSAQAEFICYTESDISLSVRKVTHSVPLNENGEKVTNECDHSNAFIFIMSSDNITNSRKRLHHLLKLSSNNRKIPIAIIVFCSKPFEDSYIARKLEMDNFTADEKISKYKIFQILGYPRNNHLNNFFAKSLRFVARQSGIDDHAANGLLMQRTEAFIIESFGDIWRRFHDSSLINPLFYKICTIPKYVTTIYNEAIDRVINILSEDIEDMPEFPEELKKFVPKNLLDIPLSLEYFPSDWKNPNRSFQLIKFFKKLKLPDIEKGAISKLEDVHTWILEYANKCLPEDKALAFQIGCYAANNLNEALAYQTIPENELTKYMENISWLNIIKPIAQGLLKDAWANERCSLPNEVIYQHHKFEEFQETPWWLNCNIVQRVKIAPEKTCSYASPKDVCSDIHVNDVESILRMGIKASARAEKNVRYLRAAHDRVHRKAKNNLITTQFQFLHNPMFEIQQKNSNSLWENLKIDADDMLADIDTPPPTKKPKTRSQNDEMTSDDINLLIDNAFALIDKIDRKKDAVNFFQ